MKKIAGYWKMAIEKIGAVQMTVIFSLLYYLLFIPLGLITSLFNDYLLQKSPPKIHQFKHNHYHLEKARKQS